MGVYKTKNPTKDGRIYYFRITYKDVFGNRHDYSSQKYKTKREASEEEIKYKSKMNDHYLKSASITIKQAFDSFIEKEKNNVKKQTIIVDYKLFKHLNCIENIRINDINVNTIQGLRKELDKKELSTTYKNKILGMLKRIVLYSSKYYLTSDNILKFIDNYKRVNEFKKEMDFFTIDEYKQFIIKVDSFIWKTFFDCLFYLGLRQGELQAVTWNDISFTKKEISVNKTLTTKIKGELWTISTPKTKNSVRVLPIPKMLLDSLKKLQKEATKYKNYSDKWFVFGNAIPFKETTIQKYKNKYCDLANLRHIRIHDFRHSCASLLINNGASISLVSKYLGHANITITLDTYTHLYESELKTITERIENI